MLAMRQDAYPRFVILDYDGTCTNIPVTYERYSQEYFRIFSNEVSPLSVADWREGEETVRKQSPHAGWMLGGTPSAPAAADPYILAYEVSNYLKRSRKISKLIPPDIHSRAYETAHAPWRESAKRVLTSLAEREVRIIFVSNSRTETIKARVDELLGDEGAVRDYISVEGDAAKFRIQEIAWDKSEMSKEMLSAFADLPAAGIEHTLQRPIYIRRGSYFEAISRALGGDLNSLRATVFCGDIWELDLAMPAQLGARVHLIYRAEPFATYDYERTAIDKLGPQGQCSLDLDGLLKWFV